MESVEPERESGPEMVAVCTALVPLPTKSPESVVEPVPPLLTESVPTVSESAMPRDDVAI